MHRPADVAPPMTAEAPGRDSRLSRVAEAREFVRVCLSTTPLREHSRILDSEAGAGQRVPEGCVLEALEQFDTDLARWNLDFSSPKDLFRRLHLAPNLQATFFYRLNHVLYMNGVALVPDVIVVLARLLSGMVIYYSAEIGPGLKVIHGLGTVIGAGCEIGSRFTVYHGVTIGDKLGRQTGGRPVIGDDVVASATQVLRSRCLSTRNLEVEENRLEVNWCLSRWSPQGSSQQGAKF